MTAQQRMRSIGNQLFSEPGISVLTLIALLLAIWLVLHLGFAVPWVGTVLMVIGGVGVATIAAVGLGALVFRDDVRH